MTYNATALGTDTAPTREEIEEAVLEFDDANNGYGAWATFYSNGEYEITAVVDGTAIATHFDRLYEFKAWTFKPYAAPRSIALQRLSSSARKAETDRIARYVSSYRKAA